MDHLAPLYEGATAGETAGDRVTAGDAAGAWALEEQIAWSDEEMLAAASRALSEAASGFCNEGAASLFLPL